MSKQFVANRMGQGTGPAMAGLMDLPDTVTAADEAGIPPPVGAACDRCFSNDLVLSRKPGLRIFARLFGFKVYRCRQCLSRTCW